MPKRPMTLKVRLPPYHRPRLDWRRQIHKLVWEKMQDASIRYEKKDRLEIGVRLYLKERGLRFHDVDNRMKDIMDALQGRVGGSKAKRILEPIVPNDSQIYRVIIEKSVSPKQGRGKGHLTIKKYKPVNQL